MSPLWLPLLHMLDNWHVWHCTCTYHFELSSFISNKVTIKQFIITSSQCNHKLDLNKWTRTKMWYFRWQKTQWIFRQGTTNMRKMMTTCFQNFKIVNWTAGIKRPRSWKWESNNSAIKTFNSGRLFYALIILPLSKQFGIFSTLFIVVPVHNLIPSLKMHFKALETFKLGSFCCFLVQMNSANLNLVNLNPQVHPSFWSISIS